MSKSQVIQAMNQAEAEWKFRTMYPDTAFVLSNVSHSGQTIATLCKTDDYPVQGARKWVTKHYIYQYDYKRPGKDGKDVYVGLKKVGEEDSKTDAVKKARELTLAAQQRHTVRLVKVLESGDNNVTDIEPKINRLSMYTFTFTE